MQQRKLGIIFEFTAPGTPQQNSVAERRIPTLMGRARAMLIQAGIDSKGKGECWCEVTSTATKLDNIMVRPERAKPPHTLFYGKDAKYMKYIRTFGEMAVVAIPEGKKMRSKLDNRGKYMHVCWICRRSYRRCVQIPKHPHKKNHHE